MPNSDVDEIIKCLSDVLPGVEVTQLKVANLADDDGLWFIKVPGITGQVQIESSRSMCPFLIESDFEAKRYTGNTIEEVVAIVQRLFLLSARKAD